jgi:hypothetical protein
MMQAINLRQWVGKIVSQCGVIAGWLGEGACGEIKFILSQPIVMNKSWLALGLFLRNSLSPKFPTR